MGTEETRSIDKREMTRGEFNTLIAFLRMYSDILDSRRGLKGVAHQYHLTGYCPLQSDTLHGIAKMLEFFLSTELGGEDEALRQKCAPFCYIKLAPETPLPLECRGRSLEVNEYRGRIVQIGIEAYVSRPADRPCESLGEYVCVKLEIVPLIGDRRYYLDIPIKFVAEITPIYEPVEE